MKGSKEAMYWVKGTQEVMHDIECAKDVVYGGWKMQKRQFMGDGMCKMDNV